MLREMLSATIDVVRRFKFIEMNSRPDEYTFPEVTPIFVASEALQANA
jgi:hypothetical protein